MSGWGGTTKVARVIAKPLNVDKDHWYTLLVEWCDDACLVRVDDHLVLYGEAKEFAVTKGQFALQSSGDGAWYDDVRLWDAITDPTWAKRKADVVALAAKSH
jgi:hypothetical protein